MDNQEALKKKPFYKKWWVWVIGMFVLFIIIGSSGDSTSQKVVENGQPEELQQTISTIGDTEEEARVAKQEAKLAIPAKDIEYSILREWNPNNDFSAVGLEILINPQGVSRDNIITLVKLIGLQSNKVVVKIYKTRDAWNAERNETYGAVYNEGYIAFYVKNTTSSGAYRGSNEIRWMQETGELKDLFGTKTRINN